VKTDHPQALPHTTVGFLYCSAALSVSAVTLGAHPNGDAGLQPLQTGMFKKQIFVDMIYHRLP